MLINVPPTLVQVNNRFLTNGAKNGFTHAYLVAARCIKSRPILWTAHLENGALYAGLPINAIFAPDSTKLPLDIEIAQPWSCLEAPANAVRIEHVKDYEVAVKMPGFTTTGTYLFTIDYSGEGLAQDPEQHKSHNIIATESHSLMALPNNYCVFTDKYFTAPNALPLQDLKRQTKYWSTY